MTNVEYKCEGHGFAMNLLMAMHIKGISLLWVSWVSWERGETPLTRKGPETDRLRWARGRELKRFQDIFLSRGLRLEQQSERSDFDGAQVQVRVEVIVFYVPRLAVQSGWGFPGPVQQLPSGSTDSTRAEVPLNRQMPKNPAKDSAL